MIQRRGPVKASSKLSVPVVNRGCPWRTCVTSTACCRTRPRHLGPLAHRGISGGRNPGKAPPPMDQAAAARCIRLSSSLGEANTRWRHPSLLRSLGCPTIRQLAGRAAPPECLSTGGTGVGRPLSRPSNGCIERECLRRTSGSTTTRCTQRQKTTSARGNRHYGRPASAVGDNRGRVNASWRRFGVGCGGAIP